MKIVFSSATSIKLGLFVCSVCFFSLLGHTSAINYACQTYSHTDHVVVAPYNQSPVVDDPNFSAAIGGLPAGYYYREYITLSNKYRIRQSGTVTNARMYFYNEPGYASGVYITIWRPNTGGTYDLIRKSENILPQLGTSGVYNISFTDPLTGIQEGDYYGYRIEAEYFSGTSVSDRFFFHAIPVQTGGEFVVAERGSKYVADTDLGTGYDWDSTGVSYDYLVPIELIMSNPDMVFLGDSLTQGAPWHTSLLEGRGVVVPDSRFEYTMSYNLGLLTNYVTHNMGKSNYNSSLTMISKLTGDVLPLKPRVVVIQPSQTDITTDYSKTGFLANMDTMIALASAEPTVEKVLVLSIFPWNSGTNQQHITRDDWNSALNTLTQSYPKAKYVDIDSYIGQYRAGGLAGNLWDLQMPYYYDSYFNETYAMWIPWDGRHLSGTGYARVAQAIRNNLCTPTVSTTITAPVNGATLNNPNQTILGVGLSGDTITLRNLNGVVLGTTLVGPGGVWSIPITLSEGFNGFTYRASDGSGNMTPWMSYSLTLTYTLVGGFAGGGGGGGGYPINPVTPPTTPTTPTTPTSPVSPVIPTIPTTPISPIYPIGPTVTSELEDAFTRGTEHGLVADTDFDKYMFLTDLTRGELARLIVLFEKNVMGNSIPTNPACDLTLYVDYSDILPEYRQYVKDACNMGVMGRKNDKEHLLPAFKPYKKVTRAQLGAVLARYFYGDFVGDMSKQRYVPYLDRLYNENIMKQIDKPDMIEKKGYVITMLQRYAQQ